MLCLVEIYDFFDFLLFIGAMTSYLVQNGQISRGSGKFSKEDYQTIISWKFQSIAKMRSGSCAKYYHIRFRTIFITQVILIVETFFKYHKTLLGNA